MRACLQVEARLGIGSNMDAWTERMRSWLASYILAPLVKSMDLMDGVGLPMSTAPPALPATSPLWQTTPSVTLFAGSTPLSQQAMMVRAAVAYSHAPARSRANFCHCCCRMNGTRRDTG